MILALVHIDSIQNSLQPLDDERSQAVLLVEVGVQVLLHGFSRLARLLACIIKLEFGSVDVGEHLTQLLQREDALLDLTEWCVRILLL